MRLARCSVVLAGSWSPNGNGLSRWRPDIESDQGVWVGAVEQRFCASQIVGLPGRDHQVDRIAQRINKDVNLGGQSAARSADRLRAVFFRAPALCW